MSAKNSEQVKESLKEFFSQTLCANDFSQVEDILLQIQNKKKDAFFLGYSRLNIFAKREVNRCNVVPPHILRNDKNNQQWNLVELLRVSSILELPFDEDYHQTLDQLLQFADFKERIAYYKGLIFYHDPLNHYKRAREGLRSNIQLVFEAIAIENTYPLNYFDDDAWNQMILKAFFMGVNVNAVKGLKERENLALKTMLIQYAQERVAASRRVDPRLWRCVGTFLEEKELHFLEAALCRDDENEQMGAILTLRVCELPEAKKLLIKYSHLDKKATKTSMTWESLIWENLYYDTKK